MDVSTRSSRLRLATKRRRLRLAGIGSLVGLAIVFGSVAGAEVTRSSPETAPTRHLSLALVAVPAAALAAPRDVRRETPDSRTILVKGRWHDRWIAHRQHVRWLTKLRAERARAAAARAAAAQAAASSASSSSSSSSGSGSSGGANWYAIAACESGGNWSLNTGNGFWGGLQFTPSTWFANGGGPFSGDGPFPYSAGAQIAVAERVLAAQGPGAWPNCFQ
jgi:Transglycosylase-like domain